MAGRIAQLIRERGLTQKGLAVLIGAPQSTVQQWVAKGTAPGAELLSKLPAALKVNGHWLLTGLGPMEPPGEDYELERERATARRQLAEKLIQAVGQVVREVAEREGVITSPEAASVPADQLPEILANDAKIRREAAKQGRGTKRRA